MDEKSLELGCWNLVIPAHVFDLHTPQPYFSGDDYRHGQRCSTTPTSAFAATGKLAKRLASRSGQRRLFWSALRDDAWRTRRRRRNSRARWRAIFYRRRKRLLLAGRNPGFHRRFDRYRFSNRQSKRVAYMRMRFVVRSGAVSVKPGIVTR